MRKKSSFLTVGIESLLVLGLVMSGGISGFAGEKDETIEATAFGTGTQMGQNIGVKLIIYEYSTPEDREILVQAFQKGSNKGLVNALGKMKAVGHMSITGALGSDVSYIKVIPTPTGRKIRFITNRQIRFGEAWSDSSSQAFDLSGGELDINDQDKKKSTGVTRETDFSLPPVIVPGGIKRRRRPEILADGEDVGVIQCSRASASNGIAQSGSLVQARAVFNCRRTRACLRRNAIAFRPIRRAGIASAGFLLVQPIALGKQGSFPLT